MQKIKQLSKTDYDEVFALSQFAFQFELSDEAIIKKKEEAERHIIWGWMAEDKLAAKVHVIPLSVLINGKTFDMGGVAGVATWPEYRRSGMVKKLLLHSLKEMKKNGQVVSYLHPFSVPFYRNFGWEVCFNNKKYTVPIESLKRKWNTAGYVRRVSVTDKTLYRIYANFAENYNGVLIRDEKWWKQCVLNEKAQIAVAYNQEDVAVGYLIYHVKEDIFTLDEMAYETIDGWKQLLEFIANHDSMAKEVRMTVPENDHLPLFLDEPRFEQKIIPYFMMRIVDVLAFLKMYPFLEAGTDKEINMHVVDSFLEENSGTYQLTKIGTDTEIQCQQLQVEEEDGIHCSVQHLAQMLLGYKRPLDLYELVLIQGAHKDIEQFDHLIPKRQTLLTDFF
ncbi:GNAT family N-acetyltransferase [Oceanobacillus chungangensis]|uniref:GNAT family N-acetyltransferase n=1 Tax=Oceanobacillus chungangensis TaxID=1229152 RepID=A0A3D8PRK5_9BACI|nr:GNAT family N-acetyltransferase [Oceanobacillus chungangensis]RDW18614.1 GNAT family N-acetyltransferase [Oceanobacillus chungangensis]